MLEKSNSQYESFVYWRQPIPALDLSELDGLGVMEGKADNGIPGKDWMALKRFQEEEVESPEYSAFHYWRQPIAHIDSLMTDLNLLLL